MGFNKLARFNQINSWSHVFQASRGQSLRNKWLEYLPPNRKVNLELACGKGEYTVALAEKYPDQNYLGIDIKGDRLYIGAKKSMQLNLPNVGFLCCFIQDLSLHFQAGDVNEIWITFPDPYLSFTKFQKRLTHPNFLKIYAYLMHGQGLVHLKTDEPKLHEFTRKVLKLYQIPIIKELCYQANLPQEDTDSRIYIPTSYELKNISQSQKTYYLAFQPKLEYFTINYSKKQLREFLR